MVSDLMVVCNSSEYARGSWQPHTANSSSSVLPPCCSSLPARANRGLCSEPRPAPPGLGKSGVAVGSHTGWSPLEGKGCLVGRCKDWRETYQWVPAGCSLVPWDAQRFCAKLGARVILWIGDSTVEQAAGAVAAAVRTHFRSRAARL